MKPESCSAELKMRFYPALRQRSSGAGLKSQHLSHLGPEALQEGALTALKINMQQRTAPTQSDVYYPRPHLPCNRINGAGK